MTDCPFCDYEGPSKIKAKSDHTYVIEPLSPVVPGHLLVIPWAHIEDFAEEPVATADVAADAARMAQEFMDGDCNLIASKGKAATQTITHLHFHLVPRQRGDGLQLPWSPSVQALTERLEKLRLELSDERGKRYELAKEGNRQIEAAESRVRALEEALEQLTANEDGDGYKQEHLGDVDRIARDALQQRSDSGASKHQPSV